VESVGSVRACWNRAGSIAWIVVSMLLPLVVTACHREEKALPPAPTFAITDKFFDVKPLGNNGFLLLGYQSKLWRTDDAGGTFKKLTPPTKVSLTRMSFVDGGKGWGVGHVGNIFRTEDGGQAWTKQESGTDVSLFDVDFPTAQKGWAVGDISTVVSTADGGQTWKAQKVQMSDIGVREDMSLAISDPIFYSVDFLDENVGWVGGEFGQIRVTEDGGTTWGAQHSSLLGAKYRDIMSLPTILCLRMRDRQSGVAVGTYGAIITTADGGQTWNFYQSPVAEPLYDIKYLADGDSLVVGSSGIILRGNAQSGWKAAELPPGVFTWISAVAFDPSGAGVAVGGHGLVLTTSDMGKRWEWKTNG
jgi:photosystem II stability/assembly factor-like uncharacterized protein